MARMIPAFIDDDAPPGERDVWAALAGGPANWTVIHSLDLAPWRRHRRTELDFVVFVPDTGILCIEVKSHHAIAFSEDGWLPPSLGKGPFKQCQDAVHSLHDRLESVAPYSSAIPKAGLCIFPNAIFERTCLAVAECEVLDAEEFRSGTSAADICRMILGKFQRSIDEEQRRRPPVPIAPAQIDNLVEHCLPIRKRVPERRKEVELREQQLAKSLRGPQQATLSLCNDNERVVVTGGAGTGKTLIAMELALSLAERHARVALVCFNRLVGEWMKDRIESHRPGPTLIVDRAVRLLAGLLDVPIPSHADDRFWSDVLPEQIQERLTDPAVVLDAGFDYLIVDEAQDLLARPWLWEGLTLLLKGGVIDGRFALFGDVEGQSLAAANVVRTALEQLTHAARPVRWRLTENCRNYDVVGKAAVTLSGFPEDTYSGFLRDGGSYRNLEYLTFERDSDQLSTLRNALQLAKGAGFRDSDITILSFCTPENSVARRLVKDGGRLFPVGTPHGGLTYASVHAFKGMENKAIIVTDLSLTSAPESRALFYTALTRATDSAFILARTDDMKQLVSWGTGKP